MWIESAFLSQSLTSPVPIQAPRSWHISRLAYLVWCWTCWLISLLCRSASVFYEKALQENQAVKEYLPANINPRPTVSKPWNYKFQLKKRMILWVKLGKRGQSYTWGVKKA